MLFLLLMPVLCCKNWRSGALHWQTNPTDRYSHFIEMPVFYLLKCMSEGNIEDVVFCSAWCLFFSGGRRVLASERERFDGGRPRGERGCIVIAQRCLVFATLGLPNSSIIAT